MQTDRHDRPDDERRPSASTTHRAGRHGHDHHPLDRAADATATTTAERERRR